MKKPNNAKERNLVKGALRRVFSRSQLRKDALEAHMIEHSDPNRPRVTRWAWCAACGVIEAAYTMEVDHRDPLVPTNKTLEEMSWDEVMERLWCELDNLDPLCPSCHDLKTDKEKEERKAHKKGCKGSSNK